MKIESRPPHFLEICQTLGWIALTGFAVGLFLAAMMVPIVMTYQMLERR